MRTLITAVTLCLLSEILLCSMYWATHAVCKQIDTSFTVTSALSKEFVPAGNPTTNSKTAINRTIKSHSKKRATTKTSGLSKKRKDSIAAVKKVVIKHHKSVKKEKSFRHFSAAPYAATRETETGTNDYDSVILWNKADQLKTYALQNGYNAKYGFVVDMGMKSGKKRFFVIDLLSRVIINNGVVAHGRGTNKFTLDKKYSNEKGSNCTSLGIYKIGKSYNGIFGPSYKLHGLQKTNSNAFERTIVLHSMNSIPEQEIDFPIFQSEGCPAVCPEFLKDLRYLINRCDKPVLMWIYDSTVESKHL